MSIQYDSKDPSSLNQKWTKAIATLLTQAFRKTKMTN